LRLCHWESWGKLTEVVKSGRSIHRVNLVEEGDGFFSDHVQAIFPSNYHAAQNLICGLSKSMLGEVERVLDVGCGAAAWGIAFASALPNSKITALDFPQVIKIAKGYTLRFDVAHQFEYIETDFNQIDFPQQAFDLVVLGYILHNEGIERGRELIKKSFDALRPGGWLLIADIVADDDRGGPLIPMLFGLNMLVLTENGGVFTRFEMKEALETAGFVKISYLSSPELSLFLLAQK
jgi:ubiquinone/menaquinone biosynthesis C-methylase UbiE